MVKARQRKAVRRYWGWVINKDTDRIVWSDDFSSPSQRDKATYAAARKARSAGKYVRITRSFVYA